MNSLAKFLRFMSIYGLRRTIYKSAGRSRRLAKLLGPSPATTRDVGTLGCGQFAFATVGCILCKQAGNRFADCFDPDTRARDSFAEFYRIGSPSPCAADLIARTDIELVYIISNHASHCDYAVAALATGKRVYIEKPVAVTEEQAVRLFGAIRQDPSRAFVGYNRPHSAAIRWIHEKSSGLCGPLTLTCTVLGHVLGPDHWYRIPAEGTRICGNVGHWIDLAIHIFAWDAMPEWVEVTIAYSSPLSCDDDLAIMISTPRGDLVTIVITSRGEPFEGINETIVFQRGDLIAKIDDFRTMHWWMGESKGRQRYFPKDVGHVRAIMQPYSGHSRNWPEVEVSTMLMLRITDMVRTGATRKRFAIHSGDQSTDVSSVVREVAQQPFSIERKSP
jgi:predicted dehydrogenase